MCGITGAIGINLNRVDLALNELRHRGPDGRGLWRSPSNLACLGHTRLSILDLSSAAHQPMTSEDGKVAITFNGEVYNFQAIRKDLESYGVVFKSSGDTEVVLQAYLTWGSGMVSMLRGMFSFAIWDERTSTLMIARDRIGIKPLFWNFDGNTLHFSSELGALLALLPDKPRLRPQAIIEYLTWLYVAAPNTFFEGIKVLEPGHILTWQYGRSSPKTEKYWEVPRTLHASSFEDSVIQLRSQLEESVRLHLASDVPVGAFLSGGVDSSTIVGLMAKQSSKPIRTFCMTFPKSAQAYDEREYARRVANHFGTTHEELPVDPNVADILPKTLRHFGQPFGNPTALLVYELSRLMRQHVKVALSGDGGDEFLLGYPRYQGLIWNRRLNLLPRGLRRGLAEIGGLIRDSTRGVHFFRRMREFLRSSIEAPSTAYASWVSYQSRDDLEALVTPEYRGLVPENPWMPLEQKIELGPENDIVAAASRADVQSFLPENLLTYSDRMSMAHGLELRVPICDHVLADFCSSLPSEIRMRNGQPKALMKEAVKDLLPKEIFRRPKLGFNPPMGIWLSGELKPMVDEHLSDSALKKRGILQPSAVARLRQEHSAGHRDHSLAIWSMVVLQEWLDQWAYSDFVDTLKST